eukprot:CAMPEP_0172307028 /NCGR_PEP_ID=MMETSP1058-20130122/7967_1 /TAXON_ID=83371 /ORGANISM="Detonula confervacea, Strain CCMP 353" /LENGTH=331 /DNA_ID=CAMNT_0013019091 /DNA_START=285 /DNA_END=1280 /DNA_ORIENTATION=+
MLPLNAQSSIGASSDQALALWVFAFASSHIGMSAVRTSIISSLGEISNSLNLVGNEGWALPNYWPGDNTGGNKIFPDNLTAGRQIYRALYTAVSFVTLGSAFGAYLQSSSMAIPTEITSQSSFLHDACLFSAALSLGAAIASLFNASPLGLMPSFQGTSQETDEEAMIAGNTAIAGIRRDDTLKFTTRGLTRITRHPLILPVAPWGLFTAYLAGGRLCDYIIFGGLSIYAMAGCFAQDQRVIKEEGSVGTVFQTEDRQKVIEGEEEERTRLRLFFEETSFVPFKAVLDGRQSLGDIAQEVPWLPFFAGTILGVFVEEKVLQLLGELSINNV